MPLKHDTETAYILVLGFIIALTGAVAAFLPPLSVSVVPWAIAFGLAVIYPLVLYPTMKENRADHEFRALHFVPATILLVWMLLDLIVAFRPEWQAIQSMYTWGWSLAVVIAAFIFLILFCLRVIRQRFPRITLLFAVLLPFIILSQLSEREEWDRKLAMSLWDGTLTGSGLIAGGNSSNLAPSSDSMEEQWRAQLRQMERRRQELERGISSSAVSLAVSSASVQGARSSAIIASNGKIESSSSASPIAAGSTPPRLPSSGFGMEGTMLVFAAGCMAAIHRKTIRRRQG